jgi:crotonobetainyl-CoA:carnitine CoA-transferase CaiB-like acyl-CoA transferase
VTSQARATPNLPLSGVTVIDLGQVYQGPYCSLLLVRAGAEVIKVEPLGGESARRRAMISPGASLPFAMLNSNKRCVTLNLKSEAGKALLRRMVRKADVLLENFAPGVMDRLGLGYEALRQINPRLVYASGTGYGLSGRDRDRLAMDLTVQAMSGVMSVTGFPDGPPLKAGPAMADFLGGVHLYGAIVTALFQRERTGAGRLVEVAMEEAVYPTLASNLGLLHSDGAGAIVRTGNRHGGMAVAPYNVYAASDGHVALICNADNHWRDLAAAMGQPDLADDPRFSTNPARCDNMDALDQAVEAWTRTQTRAELFEIARAHRLPCAPVRTLDEVMHDPHMHERGMLNWIDHPELGRVVLPDSPLRFHGAQPPALSPSHALGADNETVYRAWLGVSSEDLERFEREGAI